jgi:hypothetical protein
MIGNDGMLRTALYCLVASTAFACGGAPEMDGAGVETAGTEEVGSTTQASTTGTYGWVWANQATGTYNPAAGFSFNSSGGVNQVSNSGVGTYSVTFPGLGGAGGNVQVTAYGSGSERCKVMGWSQSGTSEVVSVACHTAAGAPVNTLFTATYYRSTSPDKGAFVWANNGTLASYSPSLAYSWNSAGGANSITRSGTGAYAVTLGGMQAHTPEGGNPIVTAYGSGSEHCKIGGWFASGANIVVNVRCFNTSGSAADTLFSLSYSGALVPAPYNWGAYAWANDSTSATYTPATFYSATSSEGLAGISEPQARPQGGTTSTGVHFVNYPYMPASNKTIAHSVAYGTTSSYCKVGSWTAGGTGVTVTTRCFTSAGAVQGNQYVNRYSFDHFLIF